MLNEQQQGKVTPDPCGSETDPSQPVVYQIRVESHLNPDWTDWFGGLTITREENGNTLLTGPVVDQAALHGLLKKVRDLGMLLISVNRLDASQRNVPDDKSCIEAGG
jgi:hypothetical protein